MKHSLYKLPPPPLSLSVREEKERLYREEMDRLERERLRALEEESLEKKRTIESDQTIQNLDQVWVERERERDSWRGFKVHFLQVKMQMEDAKLF